MKMYLLFKRKAIEPLSKICQLFESGFIEFFKPLYYKYLKNSIITSKVAFSKLV